MQSARQEDHQVVLEQREAIHVAHSQLLATSEQLAGGLLLKREPCVIAVIFWGVFSHRRAQTITTNFLTT